MSELGRTETNTGYCQSDGGAPTESLLSLAYWHRWHPPHVTMIQVSKSQFKARALELMRQVESSGEAIIVMDRGKPTIEVRPYRFATSNPLDQLKGSVIDYVDPMEPVGLEDWGRR